MPEPGAPHTPTVAPRTRPEAEENALKGRATNDWFRHDGKNLESPPGAHVRLASKQAHEIAAKYKGESEDVWHPADIQNGNGHVNGHPTTPTKNRCHSAEAQHIREKVAGTEEDWYKHEPNQSYVSPRPKSRLTTEAALSLKDSMSRDSTDWYRHDGHGTPPKQTGSARKSKQRTPTPQASQNALKMRPTGLPIWANYSPEKDGVDGSPTRPASRLKSPDAQEYQKRSKGSASDWFSPSADAVDPNPLSPRLSTPEAAENASKQRHKVDWFNHDDNKNYVEPVKNPRCSSSLAKEMREKQRGQLGSHFHSSTNGNGVSPPHHRIKPEAEDYAKKSVQGMMQKFMDQAENKDYNSPRAGPRVRPEGESYAEKNRGVMNNCMGGYLDTPGVHNNRRIRPEAEDNANRNRGTTGNIMNGHGPQSARPQARVRPEGQANANRNNSSSLSDMMGMGQLEISGRPAPRVGSSEAQQNAQRYRGTAADVMYNRA